MQDEGVKYNYNFRTKLFVKAKTNSNLRIQMLSLGHSTNEISSILNASINTVKIHKKNIFNKLDVRNSNEAVYYATMQKTEK